MKNLLASFFLFLSVLAQAQLADSYFDTMDSLIETTPQITLCQKDGKEDLRFFSKTPEKYADYKQVFARVADTTFTFEETSHFFCDIQVEINCKGKAGNYSFSVEPRTFTLSDYNHFLKLMQLVNNLQQHVFTPAVYLGEKVNTITKFRLSAKAGKPALQ